MLISVGAGTVAEVIRQQISSSVTTTVIPTISWLKSSKFTNCDGWIKTPNAFNGQAPRRSFWKLVNKRNKADMITDMKNEFPKDSPDNFSDVTKYFDDEEDKHYAIFFRRALTEAEARQAVKLFKPWKVIETPTGPEFIVTPDSTWLPNP